MDFTATYCPVRRDLEENGWWLTSHLASLTARLLKITGNGDHQDFRDTRQECRATRDEIIASREGLLEHRRQHGC
ncbi:MAG TPA: hypothetical protein VJS11_09870 [Acidobacteriaceae bacterium]|nr:hypothetical protein [Acidobacteriaceae bacterium]